MGEVRAGVEAVLKVGRGLVSIVLRVVLLVVRRDVVLVVLRVVLLVLLLLVVHRRRVRWLIDVVGVRVWGRVEGAVPLRIEAVGASACLESTADLSGPAMAYEGSEHLRVAVVRVKEIRIQLGQLLCR